MRYIIRALKYFIQISFIFAAIIGVLMLAGWVSTDINIAIRGGWRSVGYIALIFAAFSCLYPRLGYTRRIVEVPEFGDAAVPDTGAGGEVPDAGGHYLALIDEAFRFRGYEKATPNRDSEDPNRDGKDPNRDGEDPNRDSEDPNRDSEKDPAGATCFVARYRLISRVNRAARLWEDTITVRRVAGGYEFEGLAKDLARVVSSVEQRLRV